MRFCSYPLAAAVFLSLLAGCATTAPHAEFVKTIIFSSLQTSSFKHSLVSGLEFRSSEEILSDELSAEVISQELQARGFEDVTAAEVAPDFYAVVKWRKFVSTYADPWTRSIQSTNSTNSATARLPASRVASLLS